MLVRRERRQHDLTQQELADAVGVTKQAIGAIETGDTVEPERSTLSALARVFGMKIDAIEAAVRSSIQQARGDQPVQMRAIDVESDDIAAAILRKHGGDRTAALREAFEIMSELLDG